MLAFEFYRANENLDSLDSISYESLQTVLDIFQDLDRLETNLYGQIIQKRLKVIRTLQDKVDGNSLEKVIQKFLFDHLCLLDQAWERAEETEIMEESVNKMFSRIDDKWKDILKGRLDIGYRKTAGQHVILELKRPDLTFNFNELIGQVAKYR